MLQILLHLCNSLRKCSKICIWALKHFYQFYKEKIKLLRVIKSLQNFRTGRDMRENKNPNRIYLRESTVKPLPTNYVIKPSDLSTTYTF